MGRGAISYGGSSSTHMKRVRTFRFQCPDMGTSLIHSQHRSIPSELRRWFRRGYRRRCRYGRFRIEKDAQVGSLRNAKVNIIRQKMVALVSRQDIHRVVRQHAELAVFRPA